MQTRLLVLALSLSALGAGSFWTLTQGPLAPASGFGVLDETASTLVVRPGVVQMTAGPREVPTEAEAPEPSRPAVHTALTHRTYAVRGQTPEAVLESLLEGGPRDGETVFFGLTQTALDVRYDPTEMSGGCMIEDTEVDLEVVVTLPEWAPGAEPEPELARDWGRFLRALSSHEDEHRRLAQVGADKSYEAIAGLFRPTCAEAIEEARRRLERLGVEISASHHRFDDETGHGRTDGAVWPPQ